MALRAQAAALHNAHRPSSTEKPPSPAEQARTLFARHKYEKALRVLKHAPCKSAAHEALVDGLDELCAARQFTLAGDPANVRQAVKRLRRTGLPVASVELSALESLALVIISVRQEGMADKLFESRAKPLCKAARLLEDDVRNAMRALAPRPKPVPTGMADVLFKRPLRR